MTTTEMASPRTSELRFADRHGVFIDAPSEWEPAYLLLPVEPESARAVSVAINDRPAEVMARSLSGDHRLVAVWDRAGPGWYDIVAVTPAGILQRSVRVEPQKLDPRALAHLLEDLDTRLPVALAVALRDGGARIGINLTDPAEQTLATEVARLRRAIYGVSRPGLLSVLETLADDPHRMLMNVGQWVRRERARRPSGADIVQSLWRAGNIEDGRIQHVRDRRVEHTVDLYENRLLKAYAREVERRLRQVYGILKESRDAELSAEVGQMLGQLLRARRAATFLDDVGELRATPGRLTMVLLKRSEYRAAYEGFLEFRRRMSVHLDEPALTESLRNLPYLYQVWGALLVIEAALVAAIRSGFRVASQRIVWPQAGGMYLKVLKDNHAAVDLRNEAGDRLQVYSERSYRQSGDPLRSISFTQRPDVALELTRSDGSREVYLFDPKYKLDSEISSEPGDGSPKKVDIDKMHAYRDAIRDASGTHVVRFAATLYPGQSTRYESDVAALRMYPGEQADLHRKLSGAIFDWLGTAAR